VETVYITGVRGRSIYQGSGGGGIFMYDSNFGVACSKESWTKKISVQIGIPAVNNNTITIAV
jgi:hypothetical protein